MMEKPEKIEGRIAQELKVLEAEDAFGATAQNVALSLYAEIEALKKTDPNAAVQAALDTLRCFQKKGFPAHEISETFLTCFYLIPRKDKAAAMFVARQIMEMANPLPEAVTGSLLGAYSEFGLELLKSDWVAADKELCQAIGSTFQPLAETAQGLALCRDWYNAPRVARAVERSGMKLLYPGFGTRLGRSYDFVPRCK